MKREDMERNSPYGQLMGTRVLHADAQRREIEIEYRARPEFTNRIGTLAGGMVASFLDSVTGLVANFGLPEDRVAVHKRITVDYLRPGPVGLVRGRGRVVDDDGREIRSHGELLDEAGNRLATAEATLRVISRPAR